MSAATRACDVVPLGVDTVVVCSQSGALAWAPASGRTTARPRPRGTAAAAPDGRPWPASAARPPAGSTRRGRPWSRPRSANSTLSGCVISPLRVLTPATIPDAPGSSGHQASQPRPVPSLGVDKVSRTAPAPDPTERPARGRPRPWLLPAGLLLVLAALTINVLVHGPLVTMDQHIRQTVQDWAHAAGWRWLADSPHAPAQLITDLGRATVAVPVLAVVAAVLAARGAYPASAARRGGRDHAAAGHGDPGQDHHRPARARHRRRRRGQPGLLPVRAYQHRVRVLLDRSLPARRRPARVRQVALAGLAAVWLLVGVALVWCNYHWATDVLAGWALSALIVWLALRVPLPPRPRWPARRT